MNAASRARGIRCHIPERAQLERLGVRFLRKPVSYAELVHTVRALLPPHGRTLRVAAGGRNPDGPGDDT